MLVHIENYWSNTSWINCVITFFNKSITSNSILVFSVLFSHVRGLKVAHFPTHCESSINSPCCCPRREEEMKSILSHRKSSLHVLLHTHSHTLSLSQFGHGSCVCVCFVELCSQQGRRDPEPGGLEGEVPGPGGSAHQVQIADHQDPRAHRREGGQLHSLPTRFHQFVTWLWRTRWRPNL